MRAPRFGSLHEGSTLEQGAESFVELARAGGARVDRIASRTVTDGAWYEQAWPEFVLLVAGVFVVGMARGLIRPEWIQGLSGSNTLVANAVSVGFGVFMYFPTLVEVPVARMFLDLGMHPGPLLAYLMADPELSLQSMLMVSAVIGRRKTAAK